MTSDPESRCIEYSFFNDHLHLKWFLLKIFCWLFKDPNTSQPIRKSWYCLLSLFMVHGSLTVAGSLLLYLTSHRRLNRYLNQYPLLPELSFFLGLSLSRWVLAIYFYNQVIYVIWFVESHCLVLYFTYKCRKRLCVFQACPVRNSCLKTSWSALFSSIMVFFLHFFRLCYACLSMILIRKNRYDNSNLALREIQISNLHWLQLELYNSITWKLAHLVSSMADKKLHMTLHSLKKQTIAYFSFKMLW